MRDVAVLERSYIGVGRERPQHGDHPLQLPHRPGRRVLRRDRCKLYERLSVELGFNVLFSQHGHLTLAHTELAIAGLRVRAETNQLMGVD